MAIAYPLATSSAEVDRLRMQADLFRPDAAAMLDALGVGPGWRCLDLCCGIGGITDLLDARMRPGGACIGLELDPAKVAVATRWAGELGLETVRYVQGDAFRSGLEPGSFDLVHARFALGVIPGGTAILRHALELVRPGGLLFLEEADIDGFCCHPELPEWEAALQAMVDCFQRNGADMRLGRKLHTLLAEAGLRDLRVRAVRPALRCGDPMAMHLPETLWALRGSILELGLMTAEAFEATVAAVTRHLADPRTMVLSFTMVQAAGRVASGHSA